jgi:predicted MPP superfamily phosphohydrolase
MPPARPVRQPVRRHSRGRLALFDAVEGTAALLGGRAWYARRWLSAKRLVLRREVVPVERALGSRSRVRIAQLSDLHAGRLFTARSLEPVVDRLLEASVDAVALTGDFIAHEVQAGVALREPLARLARAAPLGAYAVFGNHDYRGRREQALVQALSCEGWTFLRNDAARLGDLPLWLSGVEDPEEGRLVDIEAARAPIPEGEVEVCLCHNPSAGPALAHPGCAAILSGHTHGRQIDLPLLRDLGPRHPGTRVQLGTTRLVVSRGLGVVGVPLRCRVPAEVVLLDLVPGGEPPPAP